MPIGEQRLTRRGPGDTPAEIVVETLDQALDLVWSKLHLGAEPKSSDYHVASLATVDEHGWPQVRSVVVRQAMRQRDMVVFHTDVRSSKFAQLCRNPGAGWLFYSRRDKMQIRLQTTATIHVGDEIALQTFRGMPIRCQRIYLAPEAPGALSANPTSNLPEGLEDRAPTPSEVAECNRVFAVVDCRIETIDWLYLGSTGHRRALFCRSGDGFHGSWVAP